MDARSETGFIHEFENDLRAFWNRVRHQVVDWRNQYQWPPGTNPEESVEIRAQLEQRIRTELDKQGCLSKDTFDHVIQWGFRSNSGCSDEEVRQTTRLAFSYLRTAHFADAAKALVMLPRIGISRASKVLALSNQLELGIYDSRSAHGLSDLVDRNGCHIVAIPPGRVIRGDSKTKAGYCRTFEKYIWVLRFLRKLASEVSTWRGPLQRIADLEMAFFMRSRSGALGSTACSETAPEHLRSSAERNEEDAYWTLGPGRKSRAFTAIVDATEVTIFTGEKGTALTIKEQDIKDCLSHFGTDWFPLSNSKTADKRDPRGLGEYFAKRFGSSSSVFASHFAALWVHQLLLEKKCQNGAWWFRVLKPSRHSVWERHQPIELRH